MLTQMISGRVTLRLAKSIPQERITRAEKLSITMSLIWASRRAIARPPGVLMLTAIERLLRCKSPCRPVWRGPSGPGRRSSLITSAP